MNGNNQGLGTNISYQKNLVIHNTNDLFWFCLSDFKFNRLEISKF